MSKRKMRRVAIGMGIAGSVIGLLSKNWSAACWALAYAFVVWAEVVWEEK
jgi:hypothetical protein